MAKYCTAYTFADYLLEHFPQLNSALFDHLHDYFEAFFNLQDEVKKGGGKTWLLTAAAAAVTTRLRIQQNGEQCLYLQLNEVHRRHHQPVMSAVSKKWPSSVNGSLNGAISSNTPYQSDPYHYQNTEEGEYMYPWQGQLQLLMLGHLAVPLACWARVRLCADCDRLLWALYETRDQPAEAASGGRAGCSYGFPVALYTRLEKVLNLGAGRMAESGGGSWLRGHLAAYGKQQAYGDRGEVVLSRSLILLGRHITVAGVFSDDGEHGKH